MCDVLGFLDQVVAQYLHVVFLHPHPRQFFYGIMNMVIAIGPSSVDSSLVHSFSVHTITE
jgi:hypothetical protein